MGDTDESPVSTSVDEAVSPAVSDTVVENKKDDEVANDDDDKGAVAQEAAPSSANDKAEEDTKKEETKRPDAVATTTPKKRTPYVYDPKKITLRFLFANRDGLSVMIKCDPSDTVGEVKGALLSVWPEELPGCSGGESLRLICMGKGILMPDSRTLKDFQVPIFRTHPTPVNVSVRPDKVAVESKKPSGGTFSPGSASSNRGSGNSNVTGQGCACIIL